MNWNLQRVAIVLLLTIGVVGCSRSPHSRRDKYLSKGNEYLQKQDFQRAALEFRNAISAMPNDAEGYYRLGMASAGTGDLKTAVLSYRKALAIDPKHAGAQLKLSELMVMAADKKWSEEAQPILKGLVSGPVVTPEALNTLAVAEIKLGNVHEAQRALERALETSPQELSSSAMLARLKLANNDVAAAEQVLSKAVQAAPNSPDAHVLLSQFYATQKRYQDAEGELNSALKIDPKHGAALMTLGRLQNTLGRKDEAAKTFERLSTTGPAAFQQTYALFLYSEGRRDESVREFERIVKKNPDDRAARSQLVASYVSVNRVDDAEKTLAAALKKNEKDIDALLQRAELMLSAGKYTQAEADLNTLLHFHPDSAFAHFAMGRLRVANGSTSQARQEYAKALELDPFLAEARLELAKNLTAAKDPKGAIDVIDQAPDPIRALTPLVVERNWALWALGDMSAMRKGIDDGLARERSSDLLIQDAVWKLRNRNAAAARTAIDEALKADLTNPRTAIALRAVYGSQKQLGEAVKKMREAVALQPKSAIAQNALGDVLLSANDRAGARGAFSGSRRGGAAQY